LKDLRNKKIKERSYFWVFMLVQDTHLGSTKLLPDIAFERFEKQKNKRAQLFLGFYACSRYPSGINEVTPFVFAIKKPQQLLWIFYFIK
jgi:hypothetical protein